MSNLWKQNRLKFIGNSGTLKTVAKNNKVCWTNVLYTRKCKWKHCHFDSEIHHIIYLVSFVRPVIKTLEATLLKALRLIMVHMCSGLSPEALVSRSRTLIVTHSNFRYFRRCMIRIGFLLFTLKENDIKMVNMSAQIRKQAGLKFCQSIKLNLYISLASYFGGIGKHCRPRSDATERLHCLLTGISVRNKIKVKKYTRHP